jgi:ankyrin repeat protein
MKCELNKIVFLFSIGISQIASAAIDPILLIRGLGAGLIPLRSVEEREMTPEERLEQAAFNGDLNTVSFFLESGVSPNTQDQQLRTLPMRILMSRDRLERMREGSTLELIDLLINSQNFNPNSRNNRGDTLLLLAARTGNDEIVDCLLDLPNIDVNVRGYQGNTIMHILAFNKINSPPGDHWDAIIDKILVHPNWNGDVKNDNNQTAGDLLETMLIRANILVEKINTAQRNKPAPPPEQELSDIIIAVMDDSDIAEIRAYIENHPDLNINWQHPITGRTLPMLAAATGNPTVMETLLPLLPGYDFGLRDMEGKTVFVYAEEDRNETIIAMLEKAMTEEHTSEQ